MKCEIVGCNNEAEYYDFMDNKICEDCKDFSIREENYSEEDYEKIIGKKPDK